MPPMLEKLIRTFGPPGQRPDGTNEPKIKRHLRPTEEKEDRQNGWHRHCSQPIADPWIFPIPFEQHTGPAHPMTDDDDDDDRLRMYRESPPVPPSSDSRSNSSIGSASDSDDDDDDDDYDSQSEESPWPSSRSNSSIGSASDFDDAASSSACTLEAEDRQRLADLEAEVSRLRRSAVTAETLHARIGEIYDEIYEALDESDEANDQRISSIEAKTEDWVRKLGEYVYISKNKEDMEGVYERTIINVGDGNTNSHALPDEVRSMKTGTLKERETLQVGATQIGDADAAVRKELEELKMKYKKEVARNTRLLRENQEERRKFEMASRYEPLFFFLFSATLLLVIFSYRLS
ncbi:hypothetical protein FN846DRAFT_1018085 [Sphaerosporella brunnea]|uniref:Uncharacterized protein n=1 Tax=Sphaerosporella brunnea TaxID=1250544 RepID=A0A5J5FCT6_9PEZI|nr:hypothetical protein FN846DRAFT_1018085 [Sphaerosporella brunnea]